jgi:hypothetical protein
MLNIESLWEDSQDWELVGDTPQFEVRLIPRDMVWWKEEQYPMNYAVMNKDLGVCEVVMPSMVGALSTALQFEQAMSNITEALKSFEEPKPFDVKGYFNDILNKEDDNGPVH